MQGGAQQTVNIACGCSLWQVDKISGQLWICRGLTGFIATHTIFYNAVWAVHACQLFKEAVNSFSDVGQNSTLSLGGTLA